MTVQTCANFISNVIFMMRMSCSESFFSLLRTQNHLKPFLFEAPDHFLSNDVSFVRFTLLSQKLSNINPIFSLLEVDDEPVKQIIFEFNFLNSKIILVFLEHLWIHFSFTVFFLKILNSKKKPQCLNFLVGFTCFFDHNVQRLVERDRRHLELVLRVLEVLAQVRRRRAAKRGVRWTAR